MSLFEVKFKTSDRGVFKKEVVRQTADEAENWGNAYAHQHGITMLKIRYLYTVNPQILGVSHA